MQLLGPEMTSAFTPSRRTYIGWCLASALTALCFALVTQHAWEDWYITYRAAKNLSVGNGLVFNVGERLHTFTSPFNVLLPALLNFATFNTSDDLVLWLYRIIGVLFLAGGTFLLAELLAALKASRLTSLLILVLFVTEGKTIDFTINGQEAGFWVFFMLLTFYAAWVKQYGSSLLMGAAWAGLMWSRPDSIVYIGVFALAVLVAHWRSEGRQGVVRQLSFFVRSGLWVLLLYGPWVLWAWLYYGTPVPHTVAAKGQWYTAVDEGPLHLIASFVTFPVVSLYQATTVDWNLAPPYAAFGGWPVVFVYVGKAVTWLGMMYWVVPGRREIRIISFMLFGGLCYLQFVAPYPYPWYFPLCSLFSIVVFGFWSELLLELIDRRVRKFSEQWRSGLVSIAALAGLLLVTLTPLMAYQLRTQQRVIETGHRKQIGLWLKGNATSGETVFLECLGYIGFFSDLRTYDYPGMSSPEMVTARRTLGTESWSVLIAYLKPDWLVLRPGEVSRIAAEHPTVLMNAYQLVKTFDVSRQLRQVAWLPGRPYLEYDQTFHVFKKRMPSPMTPIGPSQR